MRAANEAAGGQTIRTIRVLPPGSVPAGLVAAVNPVPAPRPPPRRQRRRMAPINDQVLGGVDIEAETAELLRNLLPRTTVRAADVCP